MSGHSKWAQIKRSKGAADIKRSVLFSKLSKKISIAAKTGGYGDPAMNFQLRGEIEKAKEAGMPNDNIDRAIKKGLGQDGGLGIEGSIYEGYGPYGTAFLIETATDNKNRTVSNIKHIFSKHGGNLGAQGSVAWQFVTRGQILIERTQDSLLNVELTAIDAGAEDVKESVEGLEIYTAPGDLTKITAAVQKVGAKIVQSEIIKESKQIINLTQEQKNEISKLFADLEKDEDVFAVYTTANL